MEAKSISLKPRGDRVGIVFQLEQGDVPFLIEMSWALALEMAARIEEAWPEKESAGEARSHAVQVGGG